MAADSPSARRGWFSVLNREVQQSPLASNVVIGMILIGLEKLVEVEFACPCDPRWNALFASAYFVGPIVLACIIKLAMLGCKGEIKEKLKTFAKNSIVPATMWLTLLFLDGQYFACAKTDWSGRFVTVDKAAPQKWCEPTNSTSSQELMVKTQRWFFYSQSYGFLLVGLSAILVLILKRSHIKAGYSEPEQESEEDEMTPMFNSGPVQTLS